MKLGAAFALMAISGLVWNSFALFLVALQGEFGWSRAEISGAYSAFALVNALTAPLVGYGLSRWDSRRLLAFFSVVLGGSLCASAWTSTIGQYWFAFGLLGGIGAHCTSSFAVFAALAGRFRERPATAMSVADAGSGLAAFLGLPMMYWIISDFGWRAAYLVLGLTVAVLGTTLHLMAMDRVRRSPRQAASSRWRLMVPSAAILVLAISYFCGSAAYHGLLTQQIALFDDRAVPERTAVWIAATAGFVVFGWRLLSGWLCDLFGPGPVMSLAAVMAVVVFLVLGLALSTTNTWTLLIYPLAIGVAFGGQQVLLANGARQIAPLPIFASTLGFCRLATGMGMASGPVIAAYTYDVTGGHLLALLLMAALSAVHFLSFRGALSLRSPAPAIAIGDSHRRSG